MAEKPLTRRQLEILAKFREGCHAVCRPGRYTARIISRDNTLNNFYVRTDTLDLLALRGYLVHYLLYSPRGFLMSGDCWVLKGAPRPRRWPRTGSWKGTGDA